MLIVEIAILIVLILVNGFLAMSELAMVTARQSALRERAAAGSRGARAALALIADPSGFLALVQIGITAVAIVAGAFGGATIAVRLGVLFDRVAWIAPHGEAAAIALVVAVVTYLSLIFGELVPKRIALASPERTAALVAPAMRLAARAATPAVWLLRASSDAVLRRLPVSSVRRSTVTEDEVRTLIAEGTGAGVFAPQEREMIDGVLRLADRSVRAIMTPRSMVAWVDVSATGAEVATGIGASRHTRLLVCDGSIDNVRGVVDARDILPQVLRGGAIDLRSSMRRPLVVGERTAVLALVDVFRREGFHYALVVDEYGAAQGVVTATDVLEAIAGDLPEQGEPGGPTIVERADGSFLVDGLLPIDTFASRFSLGDLRAGGDFDTVAGFVISRLGHLPAVGNRIVRDGVSLEVIDMDGRRIDKVLVTVAAETNETP